MAQVAGSVRDRRHWPVSISPGKSKLILADCFEWLADCEPCSIHAVVTDPPYGLVEYSENEQAKLRNGRGGVWRIPPSFDGHKRAPLPRGEVQATVAAALEPHICRCTGYVRYYQAVRDVILTTPGLTRDGT